jgi:putrescine transport system permease protein
MTARATNKLSRFNVASLAIGLAFLYLPIVILVIYSFNASRLVTVWGGWSLRWYSEFFNDRAMLDAAWMSFRVAATSARWPRWRCRGLKASRAARCFPACFMRRW